MLNLYKNMFNYLCSATTNVSKSLDITSLSSFIITF